METPASPTPHTPPPPPPPLQFDQVQFGNSAAKKTAPCVACKEEIRDSYYEANGQVLCPECKQNVYSAMTGGSKMARLLKASIFGVVTAVVMSVLYYFLRKVTDAEFAIATIAMGWVIGLAVNKGSNGRGGWFYMGAAVLLTYLAISFSYVPMIFEELDSASDELAMVEGLDGAEGELAITGENPAATNSPAPAVAAEASETAAVAGATDEVAASADGTAVDGELTLDDEGGSSFAIGIVIMTMLGFVFSLPVLMCVSSPIMILIYGFGLWQAGSMNRRPVINVTGPYNTSR